jgi:FKBP-type peptidyl-prolyl cis-trans isomerases 2
MKIDNNKVVSLTYDLEVDNEVIQSVNAEQPMEFIFGTGYLLPAFEAHILGKEEGESYEFILSSTDAYGEENPEAIVELPKNIFEVDGKVEEGLLTVGRVLPMQDSDGNRLNGSIDEIKESTVVMNFNHPLAGAELHFTGKVVAVREATEKELAEGLFAEHKGCSSEGCSSCSSCSGH